MIIVNKVDNSYDSLADQYPDENIIILNDNAALFHDEYEESVAWLNESPDIIEAFSEQRYGVKDFFAKLHFKLKQEKTNFKTLYTHDKRYDGLPNVKIVHPATPSWVSKEEAGIDPKTKNTTFITSRKSFTKAQKVRIHLADRMINEGFDVYGRGYTAIDRKSDILKNYRFCFAIENGAYAGYHSEKVLDCFRMGVVPIYWGDPHIDQLFNPAGIIRVSINHLDNIDFSILNEKLYEKMMPAVIDNYNRALQYDNSGKSIIERILKDQKCQN